MEEYLKVDMTNIPEKHFNLDKKHLEKFEKMSLLELEDIFEKTFGRKINSAPFEMDDTSYIEKLMQSIANGVDYLKDIAATKTGMSIAG